MFSLALYLCCVNSSLIIKYMLLNFIVYIAVYCFCFNIKKKQGDFPLVLTTPRSCLGVAVLEIEL